LVPTCVARHLWANHREVRSAHDLRPATDVRFADDSAGHRHDGRAAQRQSDGRDGDDGVYSAKCVAPVHRESDHRDAHSYRLAHADRDSDRDASRGADPDADRDSNSDRFTHADRDADRDGDSGRFAYANRDRFAIADRDGFAIADRDGFAIADRGRFADADCITD
jgi:hypothetical protein